MNMLTATADAITRRDIGIERSANRAGPQWQSRARGYLLEWLVTDRGSWLAEDFREWATRQGCAAPPDGRAWGHVLRAAKDSGLVRCVGYSPANSSNRAPKCLWRGSGE